MARKAVDTRTKLHCYIVLKDLRGLKHGGDRKSEKFKDSTDALKSEPKVMTDADIAKDK